MLTLMVAGHEAEAGAPGALKPVPQRITRQQAPPPVRQKRVAPQQLQRRETPPTPIGARAQPHQRKNRIVTTQFPIPQPARTGYGRQPAVYVSPAASYVVPGAAVMRRPAIVTPAARVPQIPQRGLDRDPEITPPVATLPINPGAAVMDRVPVMLMDNLTATEMNLQAEANLLREAYVTMSKAAHVYRGHRWHAMIQTARAGAILGIRLCGDGRGNTTRQVSDQRLRDAKAILERVHPMLVNKSKPVAARHVQNAINQLNTALAQP